MKTTGTMLRLSIFVEQTDQWHHKPLYAEIVHRAHQAGLAGATVIRGVEGFGATSRVHTEHLFRLSDDLPLLILIADEEDRVRRFLPQLDELDLSGLVALDPVEAIRYTRPPPRRAHWWSSS